MRGIYRHARKGSEMGKCRHLHWVVHAISLPRAVNDSLPARISRGRMTQSGRALTDSHFPSSLSARPTGNRRHPTSRDPFRTLATGSNMELKAVVQIFPGQVFIGSAPVPAGTVSTCQRVPNRLATISANRCASEGFGSVENPKAT